MLQIMVQDGKGRRCLDEAPTWSLAQQRIAHAMITKECRRALFWIEQNGKRLSHDPQEVTHV